MKHLSLRCDAAICHTHIQVPLPLGGGGFPPQRGKRNLLFYLFSFLENARTPLPTALFSARGVRRVSSTDPPTYPACACVVRIPTSKIAK